MKTEQWTLQNMPDLKGKTIIVTGGNSGLGYETVKAFASRGAEVIMASRNLQKGLLAIDEMRREIGTINVKTMLLDLEDLSSIRNFAEKIKKEYKKLDILVNNAGIMYVPYGKTKDGFERQIGINHLGHFALTGLLMDLIKSTPGARVVNVSSLAHTGGNLNFEDLMYENVNKYSKTKAYCNSKISNLFFTYELQRYFEANNIDAISVSAHPGVSETNLFDHILSKKYNKHLRPILYIFMQKASQGALPQIRAAVDSEVKGGQYYGPDGRKGYKGFPKVVNSNEYSHNPEVARRLWEESEKLTGVNF